MTITAGGRSVTLYNDVHTEKTLIVNALNPMVTVSAASENSVNHYHMRIESIYQHGY